MNENDKPNYNFCKITNIWGWQYDKGNVKVLQLKDMQRERIYLK